MKTEWISVKEQLPPISKNVIVFGGHTGKRINVAWLSHEGKFIWLNSTNEFDYVTHWMPLPTFVPEKDE